MKGFDRLAERLAELLPDWCCGRPEVLRGKYQRGLGNRSWEALIKRTRNRTAGIYLSVCLVFAFLLVLSLINGGGGGAREVTELPRPEPGQEAASETLRLTAAYGDTLLEKEIFLRILPRELTEAEEDALLTRCGNRLAEAILGGNPSLDRVSSDLKLPLADPETGVRLHWISDRPEILSEEGVVTLLTEEENVSLLLRAELSLGTSFREMVFPVTVLGEKELYAESLARLVDSEAKALGLSRDSEESLQLPSQLEPGISLSWKTVEENNLALLFMGLVLCLLFSYMKRYDQVDREIARTREAIVRDFPEFINKMVLLLNAGLVASAALERIAQDAESNRKGGGNRPLYDEISRIQGRVRETKVSLLGEFQTFSARSGVRELMRFAVILGDNMDKGNALAEKLEGEMELLWTARKKRAEEKGRTAETKLAFPLMLQLLALIAVTIMPAMLDMTA